MLKKPTSGKIKKAKRARPVYKAVSVQEDGKLMSLWVREGTEVAIPVNGLRKLTELKPLQYKPDHITSDGKYGIWCCTTLSGAKHQTISNGIGNTFRIYKAYPIGKQIINDTYFGDRYTILYPAILLASEQEEDSI
uniref:Uncharacterized protein n=1 Tax=viral metagenome TaxID=1070528 RepID=A0A6M3IP55_9ZZZZ